MHLEDASTRMRHKVVRIPSKPYIFTQIKLWGNTRSALTWNPFPATHDGEKTVQDRRAWSASTQSIGDAGSTRPG